VITAANIAQDYFRKELLAHENPKTSSKTVVIIRDSCYGHRYSRPRTSKAALGTIVERPERLQACIVGASTAYVRIGGRHAGGKYPPHPNQDVTHPPFSIRKTTRSVPLNYSAVKQVHGQKWMEELQIMCDSAEGKLAMNGKELVRPIGYGKDEAGNPLPKLHEGDLYLCSESLDALQGCLGGVCEAVDTVFGPDGTTRAFVCIRPPGHHCSSNFPSGFCWINNVHVGIAHAAMSQGLTHAAIVDFDLHHGDGSQAIAWDHNRKAAGALPKSASPYTKTPIGYFSLHDINSYPCEWGDEEKIKNASLCVEAAHGQSIWNVHLESWKNHTDFWKLYKSRYSILLEKTRTFLKKHTTRLENSGIKAKAAIFLSAGFDASEWEGAGMQRHKVNVPTDFYARFTSDVVKLAEEEGLGVGGRIISVLEGGYSDRALTSGVLSHLCGLTQDSGHKISTSETVDNGLASAMANRMNIVSAKNHHISHATAGNIVSDRDSADAIPYDSEWWATNHLEALEALTNPAPVPSALAKSKDKTTGNYSSPTQASTAKMTDPARERRSLSGQADGKALMEPEPISPPPEVDWAVASYELSRLLIPTDRQTLSCMHDELNAEATKVRRGRQSAIGLPSNDLSAVDQRMQLRDRRAKAPVAEEPMKNSSKADRRRTIAAVADLPDPTSLQNVDSRPAVGLANNRPRRRSSAGSSILSAFESMGLNDRGSQSSEAGILNGRGETVPGNSRLTLPAKADKAPIQGKIKQPIAAKAQPTKAKTSPRKTGSAPPVPKVPTAFMKSSGDDSNGELETTTKQVHSARDSTNSTNPVTKADGLDALSSGMKKMKINLKVPSPEENLARERKKVEGRDKQKKARAPKKPAVPKAVKVAPTKENRQSNSSGTRRPSVSETSITDDQIQGPADISSPIAQSIPNAEQLASAGDYVPITDIAHAEPPLQATIPAPAPAPVETEPIVPILDTIDASTTPPPNGLQLSATIKEPVLDPPPLPPNPDRSDPPQVFSSSAAAPASAPTTSKKTRADLPQFTASSPIPFAKMDVRASGPVPRILKAPDPAESISVQAAPQLRHDAAGISNSPENELPVQQQPQSKEVPPADPSIWEVPETPRH
jgi:histone deacetylase HOS3